jgi:hypothetical protein
MEWPRRRTTLSKEIWSPIRRDKVTNEAIVEGIERRQASCGECSRHEGPWPASLPRDQEEEEEKL